MHFKAIEAHLKQNGTLPVNIKVIIEGEEEVGRANLDDFVRAHKDELAGRRRRHLRLGDVRSRRAVDLLRPARPGLLPDRSARHARATCTRASFGGAVANPAMVLAQILAQMKDRGGRIKIPGFYDDVRPLTEEERQAWKTAAVQREAVPRRTSARRSCSARPATRRSSASWARPTFEVNGLLSRLHRRGREDRDSGRRDGQGQHAPRAESGSGQDRASCSRPT